MPREAGVKYAAFVSYRHVESDKKWARWLVHKLELYRTPKDLIAAGYPEKLGRVYRDEDEFSATPNLHQHIKDALDKSMHLVVICSRNTPQSKWVDQEIEYFSSLGRRDKILVLLVDGEPIESFPKALWQIDYDGNNIEPAAADVRPAPKQRNKTTKNTALLRIIAPILGCTFDELRNRQKLREQKKKLWTITVVFGSLLLFFAILALQKIRNAELQEQATIGSLTATSELLTSVAESAAARDLHTEATAITLESINHSQNLLGDRSAAAKDLMNRLENQKEFALLIGHSDTIHSIDFSEDGKFVLTASQDAKVRVWNAETAEEVLVYENETPVYSATFSPDSSKIALSTGKGECSAKVLDSQSGRELLHLKEENNTGWALHSISFSPDGSKLLTACRNGKVWLWNAKTGKKIKRLGVIGGLYAAFSQNGHLVIYGGHYGNKIYNLHTDTETEAFQTNPHKDMVYSSAFGYRDREIVSSSADKTIKLWRLYSDGSVIFNGTLIGHRDDARSVDFSGTEIITASDDKTVRIWDSSTKETTLILAGHTGSVNLAKYNPADYNYSIATTSTDNTARLWNVSPKFFISTRLGRRYEMNQVWEQKKIDHEENYSWIFALAAKVLPRCLTPNQREFYRLSPDPPCWCQEKPYPELKTWEDDYLRRNPTLDESDENGNWPSGVSKPNPFTHMRHDMWICPTKGKGYSAPWNDYEDIKALTPWEILQTEW